MSHDDPRNASGALIYEARGLENRSHGEPVLILLHGRGSNERDLLGLYPMLEGNPALGSRPRLLTPRAPFAGSEWGYGPGWAWYRYIAEDRVEPDTLSESLSALDGLIEQLPAILGGDPGPIVLGGFSQGGTTALAYALTRPGVVGGVANLSGFLARVPDVDRAIESAAEDLDVFWGHGKADPNIPFALGEKGRARLLEHGASVEAFDHPSGHTITPNEMAALGRWLEELLGSTAS